MSLNGVIFQSFEWYTPDGGQFWRSLEKRAEDLRTAGFTAVWLPPACKGSGPQDVGYGIYDLFDLGEFNQKGSVATKYGTRKQFEAALKSLRKNGLDCYFDTVLNHKNSADGKERVQVQEVDGDDRNQDIGGPFQTELWTRFDFPGRQGRYSSMQWRWWHFDCVGWDATRERQGVFVLKDKHFETQVDPEHGNYDFLMACDLDSSVDQVRGELKYWGDWLLESLPIQGFRLDAVKHIRAGFYKDWLDHVRRKGRELFAVGEYWSSDLDRLLTYLGLVEYRMSLLDVPLHARFRAFAGQGSAMDLRTLFDDTLVRARPSHAVTFVDNHDTQDGQIFQPPLQDWFKPLAYASILLREGGYPIVFSADYDGPRDTVSHRFLVDRFLRVRRDFANGPQRDFFTHPNRIGWMRDGEVSVATVLNTGDSGSHWMDTGRPGQEYFDHTGHFQGRVVTADNGWAEFPVKGGSVGVFCSKALD